MKNLVVVLFFIAFSCVGYSQDTTRVDSSIAINKSDSLKFQSKKSRTPDKADLLGAQLSKVILQQKNELEMQKEEIERLKKSINNIDLTLKDARRLQFIGIGSGLALTTFGGILFNSERESDRSLGYGLMISGGISASLFYLGAWYTIGSN